MKHRAFTLVEMIVVVLILAALLFPVFATNCYPSSPRSHCLSNLKQIGLGFLMYAQDYDDHFPTVAASGGWSNAAQPYIKTWQVFHCPATNSTRDGQTTDYYMNARLSNVNTLKIENGALSILLGDGTASQAPDYSLMRLPDAWRQQETSPAHRHLETANYLFADGHVKSLKPEKITLDKPGENNPTFLPGWSR